MSKQEWVLLIGAVIVGVFAVICVVGLIIERKKLKGKEFDEEKFAEPEGLLKEFFDHISTDKFSSAYCNHQHVSFSCNTCKVACS